ncbi:MAG: GGDEF domain-containing protein [Woeseiaceae bacterium]
MLIANQKGKNIRMPESLQINSDYKRTLLEGLDLFQDVRADDVQASLQRCDRKDIDNGELLLSPDQKNEHVYIVLSGSLSVHVGSAETPALATISPGECVGEMSIIEDRDPSAFVLAAEATHLLEIHRSILWEMVNASHEFSKNLLVVLSERVRSHNQVIADNFGELRKFERHANTDALTGLSNRHAMNEKFGRELSRCVQNDVPVAMIMIDVDNFKRFNDMFGHVAGDRALCAVAAILKQQFRPRDLLARYGGDEFAVLLPDVDINLATTIADRVRSAVSGDTGESQDSLIQVPIKISMGVASLQTNSNLSALIRDADAALYRAKSAGRNSVCD